MALVEQALYFVVASIVGDSNICKGNVLNVGLGAGISARAFLWSPFVTKVNSVEINQAKITAYQANYPANNPLELGTPIVGRTPHNIRLGDAATIPANQINPPFDFAFIDTLEAYDSVIYNKLKDIATRLAGPGALTATGRVCVQWQADVQIERQARQWMEDNGWIAETIRPELAYNGWGRAANMIAYHR